MATRSKMASGAEKLKVGSAARTVTLRLTDEHLRKIVEYNLLRQDEISDPVKLGQVLQKSLDTA